MTIHYIFRLTPAWPKTVSLSDTIMDRSLIQLQTGVFERFGEVSISVSGPPTEQIQGLLGTLNLPDGKVAHLGQNPFADVRPDDMVFIFEAPAYLDEGAVLEIMGLFARANNNVYHIQMENGRPLQIYVLKGEAVQSFAESKTVPLPVRGVRPADTPLDFHYLREYVRESIILRHVENGVIIKNPGTVSIGGNVIIEKGAVIEPGTVLKGQTNIGSKTRVGPNTDIYSCKIGEGCTITKSTLSLSTLENGVRVGPYAHIRPGCHLSDKTMAGSFTELKNAKVGAGSIVAHLSYIGDAEVGRHVNVGCGSVTANFDGVSKHVTRIGDDAFLGCNSVLIAPVTVGEGSVVSAGSTVTADVPPFALAIARSRQINKEDWALDRERNW